MTDSGPSRRSLGFTLIELMVVVVIMGVLAAIAVPALVGYARRARTSEVTQTLGSLYGAASSLYVSERVGESITSTVMTACVAEPNALSPTDPSPSKQPFPGGPGFDQLGYKISDYVYFGYGFDSIGKAGGVMCFQAAGAVPSVYTFYAHGDLDGDHVKSTFELAVGANEDNQLFHARGLYIAKETE